MSRLNELAVAALDAEAALAEAHEAAYIAESNRRFRSRPCAYCQDEDHNASEHLRRDLDPATLARLDAARPKWVLAPCEPPW